MKPGLAISAITGMYTGGDRMAETLIGIETNLPIKLTEFIFCDRMAETLIGIETLNARFYIFTE